MVTDIWGLRYLISGAYGNRWGLNWWNAVNIFSAMRSEIHPYGIQNDKTQAKGHFCQDIYTEHSLVSGMQWW